MKLALRELQRRPGRFVVATAILTLIALLLMFLGGLLDGLIAESTGALRAQQGGFIVYSSTSQNSLVRSRITPEVRAQVASVAGPDAVGGLGSVQLGARVPGRGVRDLVPVVLFGYEAPVSGLPTTPPGPGEVIADSVLKASGVAVGSVLELGPARTPVRVVGFVDDTEYLGQGTLWGSLATWHATLAANRPAERLADGVVQALIVRRSAAHPGISPAQIDAATAGATTTLTIAAAINALPGVSQQQTVFNEIIGVTVVIAIVVVALFFALITIERTALYGVLKALGASSPTLFAGVVAQAIIVALIASAISILAALLLAAVIPPGSLPFTATPFRLATSVAYLVVAAVLGCAFSLRRVLRIDPAAAIGGE